MVSCAVNIFLFDADESYPWIFAPIVCGFGFLFGLYDYMTSEVINEMEDEIYGGDGNFSVKDDILDVEVKKKDDEDSNLSFQSTEKDLEYTSFT